MAEFEKLGSFYLGKRYDADEGEVQDDLLLYDSKDLTTHAVCVGMTGSGKTGLCVSLLEEAAMDGIPALAIDPKGDLGNLLLTFPELQSADFKPWVNDDDARKKDMSVDEYAEGQAALWRKGLAGWGQDGERIRKLRQTVDMAIYTPGSDAGLPISILDSFHAPPPEVRGDGDAMRERVTSTTTGLLGLLGIDADPLQSREHILISMILDRMWREGRDLDLAGLIGAIQSPPIERVGVMELESFYPEKDRFALAMQLNNLLAAPGFQSWLTGQSLNVHELLYTPEGRPRIAVLSIAHLSESERMFFVSLLLNQVLAWMRSRPGTTSLRALLYMDEIFGFVPPTAEPPSKKPLLTLLKQARAYGLGVVLATQNPVDLDYKGLSNTGTWFLGRLQTERDKARVLEGLESLSGRGMSRSELDRTLSGLGKRVFLMHNVHEDAPVLFHTRWAMSYLRGPLTRDQIRKLMKSRKEKAAGAKAAAAPPVASPQASAEAQGEAKQLAARPALRSSIPQCFLPRRGELGADALVYTAQLIGMGRVQFVDRKTKKQLQIEEFAFVLPPKEEVYWDKAQVTDLCPEDLGNDPEAGAGFGTVPAVATSSRSYTKWRNALKDNVYRSTTLDLFRSPSLGLNSEPGENEREFRIRLTELARERRDRMSEKLRKKYARRLARLEERIRKADMAISREQEQAKGQKLQTAISMGATVLSALLGRKKLSYGTVGKATSTLRGVGRASKEKQDVARAEANAHALRLQLDELNRELESEIDALEDRLDPLNETLETTAIRPRRSDVEIRRVALAWAPHRRAADGTLTPIWE